MKGPFLCCVCDGRIGWVNTSGWLHWPADEPADKHQAAITRTVLCCECNGVGRRLEYVDWPNSSRAFVRRCSACDGTGAVLDLGVARIGDT